MTLSRHKRRWLGAAAVLAAAAFCLCACSSGQEEDDWGDVYNILSQAFGGSTPGVSLQDAAVIPFATIGIRVDGGQEGILVLATNNPEQQLWTSASHIVLLTQKGRILRTAGLPHNRTGMRLVSGNKDASPLEGSVETHWEEDFGDLHQYSIQVACRTAVRGPDGVKNFASVIPAIRVDEECHSDQLNWSFTNSYWISPKDGLTWRSVQYVSPKLGPLDVEILRPPSK